MSHRENKCVLVYRGRGENGRSWGKVDGPKRHKVDGLRKWTVRKAKVDGPQKKMKPQKCVGIKNMKVDGLRLRGQ